MLWFTVWTVLVLATLAGAFVLGRDLWRKGRALMAELERAADVVGQLADRADALTEAAAALAPTHDLLTDPDRHRERLAELADRRAERRAARAARHSATYTRWRAYTR
ncbi:hypothetical protein [Cellulomonas sp. ATA003]|uniref:hypothetical protein n=1 Tax=Cellulomonas sp. ATA003 TaxID=3073064 RepID=UPI002872F5BF|nr:hypothetical protein [Cellulomonas sp. ATA003]WNB84273.1 hypothetical protein REH70_10200 [Cellulomonas sp. ATA003]